MVAVRDGPVLFAQVTVNKLPVPDEGLMVTQSWSFDADQPLGILTMVTVTFWPVEALYVNVRLVGLTFIDGGTFPFCVTIKVLFATPGALTVMVAVRAVEPVLLSQVIVKPVPLAPVRVLSFAHVWLLDAVQLPTMLTKVTVSVLAVASFHSMV